MKPYDLKDMMINLVEKIEKAEIIYHPDTENTFAAYQIIISQPGGAMDLWINARNMDIIGGGRVVNRT